MAFLPHWWAKQPSTRSQSISEDLGPVPWELPSKSMWLCHPSPGDWQASGGAIGKIYISKSGKYIIGQATRVRLGKDCMTDALGLPVPPPDFYQQSFLPSPEPVGLRQALGRWMKSRAPNVRQITSKSSEWRATGLSAFTSTQQQLTPVKICSTEYQICNLSAYVKKHQAGSWKDAETKWLNSVSSSWESPPQPIACSAETGGKARGILQAGGPRVLRADDIRPIWFTIASNS